jgi:hypothetical protein
MPTINRATAVGAATAPTAPNGRPPAAAAEPDGQELPGDMFDLVGRLADAEAQMERYRTEAEQPVWDFLDSLNSCQLHALLRAVDRLKIAIALRVSDWEQYDRYQDGPEDD